ncbi:MAG TPA: hypothetical protein PLR99_10040 [Polyangiaceae bacterium]|jgi:hypothetical protein|nr:hypothetical protein [Polyangiaceae bacterium]
MRPLFRTSPLTATSKIVVPAVALALAMAGCVIESSSSSSGRGYGDVGTPAATAPAPNKGGPSPVLVEVDTNARLQADPGEGVGVFVEYGAGGKWHIFWSCDTNQTQRTCDYQVKVRAAQGKLSSVTDEEGRPVATTAGEVSLRRTIGLKNDGLRFEGEPGGVVTLEVTLDGRTDDVLFFFVQNGKQNGGYEGNLTNPIQVQGKTP